MNQEEIFSRLREEAVKDTAAQPAPAPAPTPAPAGKLRIEDLLKQAAPPAGEKPVEEDRQEAGGQ